MRSVYYIYIRAVCYSELQAGMEMVCQNHVDTSDQWESPQKRPDIIEEIATVQIWKFVSMCIVVCNYIYEIFKVFETASL